MKIKIKKLTNNAITPKYAREGEAGLDFFSNEETIITPRKRLAISTGISMAIPNGYVGLIWDRSSMAGKFGITKIAGVIDSTYRGEIKIVLYNLTDEPFKIEPGMKIAQMVIQKYEPFPIHEVEELDETDRGEGSFGSTGKF